MYCCFRSSFVSFINCAVTENIQRWQQIDEYVQSKVAMMTTGKTWIALKYTCLSDTFLTTKHIGNAIDLKQSFRDEVSATANLFTDTYPAVLSFF